MLVVDLLVFGPVDFASGFLVASGLCCTGAQRASERLWVEGLEFSKQCPSLNRVMLGDVTSALWVNG